MFRYPNSFAAAVIHCESRNCKSVSSANLGPIPNNNVDICMERRS